MTTTSTTKAVVKVRGKKAEAKKPEVAAQAPVPAAPATRDEKREKVAALCQIARTGYNGGSLTVRVSGKLHPLATYLDRIRNPRKTPKGMSTRDHSQLAVIAHEMAADGTFDPSTFPADLDVVSRLYQMGYLAVNGDQFSVTEKFRTTKV